ncbi:MAG: DUF6603 domain-containing protein [Cyanobacteria bacterium P01_F01_bin.143]
MPTAQAESPKTIVKEQLNEESLQKTITHPHGTEIELEFNLTDDISITIKGITETNNKGESTYVGIGQAKVADQDITISLGDIIKLFAPNSSLPDALDRESISCEYILLTYQSGENGKWIIGIDINLQALDIANIPLLGSLIEEGLNLPLADDLLLLYGSSTFTKEDLDFVNEQIGEDLHQIAIPEKAKKTDLVLHPGINISGKLKYSDDPSLNLSHQKNEEEKEAKKDQDSALDLKILIWKKIQKKFGPLSVDKIGISFDLETLTLGFMMDAGLDIDNFSLGVEDLSISSPLNEFTPSVDFEAIAITFKKPDLNIAGVLVKFHGKDDQEEEYTEYIGELKLDIGEQVNILGIGGFAEYDKQASFFGYAFLGYPIPIEPPDIVIEGFALGFGFNQGIHAPSADELEDFPLITEVMSMSSSRKKGTTQSGEGEEAETKAESEEVTEEEKDNTKKAEDEKGAENEEEEEESAAEKLLKEFTSLNKYVFPNIHTYFGAAGIKANFAQHVDAFVLLMLEGGNRWELDLFGMVAMDFPPPEVSNADAPKIAHIGASLVATIAPSDGYIGIAANITSDSYIISKDCIQPTGGVALYSWYGGEHAGDFIITIGGYNPYFNKPSYYPKVTRILSVIPLPGVPPMYLQARIYVALCAHAIMAGLDTSQSITMGVATISFELGVDLLIGWKPFHYDLSIYIAITVSAQLWVFHVSIQVGAYLHIWGPEFSGSVIFKAGPLTLGFAFGANASPNAQPISWKEFRGSFLPADDVICTAQINDGLVKEVKQVNKPPLKVVNAKNMKIMLSSRIPTKEVAIGNESLQTIADTNTNFGIAPMGLSSSELKSFQTIKVTRKGYEETVEDDFSFTPVKRRFAKGQWGESTKPSLNEEKFVENALSGFIVTPKKEPTPGKTHDLETKKLKFESTDLNYGWESVESFSDIPISSNEKELLSALGF